MTSPDLRAAYAQTEYWIGGDAPHCITIGIDHPALQTMLREQGVISAAIITSDNPRSTIQSDTDNQTTRECLKKVLKAAGYCLLPSRHHDPREEWPTEYGFFVIGIQQEEALAVAKQFNQSAIVYLEQTGPAALIWTSDENEIVARVVKPSSGRLG